MFQCAHCRAGLSDADESSHVRLDEMEYACSPPCALLWLAKRRAGRDSQRVLYAVVSQLRRVDASAALGGKDVQRLAHRLRKVDLLLSAARARLVGNGHPASCSCNLCAARGILASVLAQVRLLLKAC